MSIPGDLTTVSAGETWQQEDRVYDFQQCTAPHIPRAWERAPKSSFAPQRRGRTVWKRYDLRAKELDPTLHDHTKRRAGEYKEALRPIKRRRAKQAPEGRDLQHTQTPPRFFTTLREQSCGTPRRKVTNRTSLNGGKSILQNRLATDLQWTSNDELVIPNDVSFDAPGKNEPTTDASLEMGSVTQFEDSGDDGLLPPVNPDSEPAQGTRPTVTDSGQSTQEPLMTRASQGEVVSEGSDKKILTVQEGSALRLCKEDNKLQYLVRAPCGADSSKETIQPGAHRKLAELYNPVGDVILDDNPHLGTEYLHNDNTTIELGLSTGTLRQRTSPNPEDNRLTEVQDSSTNISQSAMISDHNVSYDHVVDGVLDFVNGVAPKMHLGKELSPPFTEFESPESLRMVFEKPIETEGREENDTVQHPNVDQESHIIHIDPSTTGPELQGNQIESEIKVPDIAITLHEDMVSPLVAEKGFPHGRTRSGARFSDDTSMLKDFLNRAQARKAAIPRRKPEASLVSPRRSPRKILGQLDNNSPTPTRSRDLRKRMDPPLGEDKLEIGKIGGELAAPVSCRRSTRTRLPAPVKKSVGAPSFIPVRRVDGTDPVVLQKSVAQELAIVTRVNTRRNKGESRPPKLMLPEIAVEASDTVDGRKHAETCSKMVSWDERLAYYQEAGETKEGKEKEKRPKVRRLRGLGAVNGTPAAKKVVMDMAAPGPRRPGRSRGQS
ncbi:MAG: hypothetical protein Q9187_002088 [Circinaria calcarea]